MKAKRREIGAGDRVKKRGFDHLGTVEKRDGTWCSVMWDLGVLTKERPRICHHGELEFQES